MFVTWAGELFCTHIRTIVIWKNIYNIFRTVYILYGKCIRKFMCFSIRKSSVWVQYTALRIHYIIVIIVIINAHSKIKYVRFNTFLRAITFVSIERSSLDHFAREYIRTRTNFPEQLFVFVQFGHRIMLKNVVHFYHANTAANVMQPLKSTPNFVSSYQGIFPLIWDR